MLVGVSTESLWLSADERVLPGQAVTQPAFRARVVDADAKSDDKTADSHFVLPSDDRRAFGQYETVAHPATRELTFRDLLAAINPLQHLPIVGTLYRDITGDTISPEARLTGGMLFGGPIGFIFAAMNAAVEEETGRDFGAQTLAALRGEDTNQPPPNSSAAVRLAKAADPAASPALAALAAPPAPAAAAAEPAAGPAAPQARALTQAPGGIAVSSLGPAAAALNATPAATAGTTPAAAAPTGVDAGQPAAATGLTTRSGLPGAGSITPAAIAAQTAQQAPAAGSAAQAQAQAAAEAEGIARNPREQRTFDAPQRTNNTQPRTPQPGFRPDLQPGARQGGSSLQVTRDQPVGPTPLTPASTAATAPVAPVVPAGMAPNATVPDAMQRALDKYDALLRGRRPAGGSVNQTS